MLSPFGNEDESRLMLGLLAGDPQISYQRHGALWEVVDGRPISEGNEPRDSDVARLIRAELWIVDSASITLYDPFRDAPEALIELATFGERVWLNTATWNDGLIQETIEFHKKYGPLVRNQSLTAPPGPVSVNFHWLEAWRIALAFACYKSMLPKEVHVRPVVIDLNSDLVNWELKRSDLEQKAMSRRRENRMVEWSPYKTRYDEADQSGYINRVRAWLHQTINLSLDRFGVRLQVGFSPPNTWLSSCLAPTLGGALWAQLASFIREGSEIKQCKYELCQKRFPAQNPRQEYCSGLCKENRKKRNRRRRGM